MIEPVIAVTGKPLKEHFEALHHYEAIRRVRDLARRRCPLAEMDVRNVHRLVMLRTSVNIVGRYSPCAISHDVIPSATSTEMASHMGRAA